MKRRHKKNFTLIELLFVIAILIILIGITWVAGSKVLRKQAYNKTQAEISLLSNAVRQYKTRFGAYPPQHSTKSLNFAQYLSDVQPNQSAFVGDLRPMYIDFDEYDIIVTSGYDSKTANATGTFTVSDPYENAYIYLLSTDGNSFIIYSKGLNGESTDSDNAETYDPTAANNPDNVTSDDL